MRGDEEVTYSRFARATARSRSTDGFRVGRAREKEKKRKRGVSDRKALNTKEERAREYSPSRARSDVSALRKDLNTSANR